MMRVDATVSVRTGKVTLRETEVDAPPQAVSRYQFKAALIQLDMFEDVAASISAAGLLVQLAWAEAPSVRRGDDLVSFIATQGGYADTVIDQVFSTAASIT